MASPVLGIEYANDGIRIVETIWGNNLRVQDFAIIDSTTPPERRGEQLRHLLETRGFRARRAIVALSGHGLEHRLVRIQPGHSLEALLTGEAAQSAAGAPPEWTHQVVPHDHPDVPGNHALLVTADSEFIRSMRGVLSGLEVVQITTAGAALANLVARVSDPSNSAQCGVHVYGNRCQVVFQRGEQLLLARDIQVDYRDPDPDAPIARLVTELKRSILHLRQYFPELDVAEVVFSGTGRLPSSAAAAVRQRLDVETRLLSLEDNLDVTELRADSSVLRQQLSGLCIALGAAWREEPGTGINLLKERRPVETTLPAPQPSKLSVVKIAWIAAAAVVLLALLYSLTRPSLPVTGPSASSPGPPPSPETSGPKASAQPAEEPAPAVQVDRPAEGQTSGVAQNGFDATPSETKPIPPAAGAAPLPAHVFSGVLIAGKDAIVFLNGQSLRRGSRIGRETVREIREDSVILESQGVTRQLSRKTNPVAVEPKGN